MLCFQIFFFFFLEVTVLLYIHVGSSHNFISKLSYALLADGNYYYTLFLQIRNTFRFSLDLQTTVSTGGYVNKSHVT